MILMQDKRQVEWVSITMAIKHLPITACKQYCLTPAHAGQHKATSPTRKPLVVIVKPEYNEPKIKTERRNNCWSA